MEGHSSSFLRIDAAVKEAAAVKDDVTRIGFDLYGTKFDQFFFEFILRGLDI